MSAEFAIDINNVSKIFPLYASRKDRIASMFIGHRWRERQMFAAVSNVSLSIKKGESVGLLGVNGAGKSTLLQMIAGTLTPSGGTVSVIGSISALLELGSGFNPLWTGRENATFQCRINGVDETDIPQRIDEIEAFAEVGGFFDQPMRTYSSGMYMRVAFASAITVDPDILIVDEALAVGDARFQSKCFNRFFDLQKAGKTILFVTHSTELVVKHCTRGIVLDKGEVIFDGAPGEANNVYYRILYGAGSPTKVTGEAKPAAAVSQAPQRVRVPADFFETEGSDDAAPKRLGYNPKEFRFGDQTARITDFEIYKDGKATRQFADGDVMTIVMRVHFLEDKPAPFYGLVLKTVDDVRIYGSTNDMQGHRNGPVKAGDVTYVSITCPLPLLGGPTFLDLGVGSTVDGEVVTHDGRFSITHIEIGHSAAFNGMTNLGATFETIE